MNNNLLLEDIFTGCDHETVPEVNPSRITIEEF
jgi:hypothetical protein